jgi:hypothetical protein
MRAQVGGQIVAQELRANAEVVERCDGGSHVRTQTQRIRVHRRFAAWCEARGGKVRWPPNPAGGTLEEFRAGFEVREVARFVEPWQRKRAR